jgi:hypothetical protein
VKISHPFVAVHDSRSTCNYGAFCPVDEMP